MKIPPTADAIRADVKSDLNGRTRIIAPTTQAPAIQPIKYPAVGPAKTPRPPRPPDNSGAPQATTKRKSATDVAPRRAPRMTPASITPSVCAVTGTPAAIGKSKRGARPSAPMSAAKSDTRTRSRVCISFLWLFESKPARVQRFGNMIGNPQ